MVLVKNNVKLNRRNIQQKQKKVDSFINDESLSSSDSESLYHTALTNPRTSTNSTASKPMPVPASIKRYMYIIFVIYTDKDTQFNHINILSFWCRLQVICDTDTEDENDEFSNSKKNLDRRRLSFSDDESSNTSEFDPGDYVPPKNICKKGKKYQKKFL